MKTRVLGRYNLTRRIGESVSFSAKDLDALKMQRASTFEGSGSCKASSKPWQTLPVIHDIPHASPLESMIFRDFLLVVPDALLCL